jgi:hypothetical protein
MSRKPPLLPEEALHRVLRAARLDGTGVLVIAGAFALASAAVKDTTGAAVGLLVAGAGAVELHGAALVRHGSERGMRWLVASQLFLMAIIFGYIGYRLRHADVSPMLPLLTDDQRQAIAAAGFTVDQFLRMVYVGTYAAVGVGTLLYQGGMCLYYLRRRPAVAAALREDGAFNETR